MSRFGWRAKIRAGIVRKQERQEAQEIYVLPSPVNQELIDKNKPTYGRLRLLVSGILSGQVDQNKLTPQHLEVLNSFEAYLSAKDMLTEKQLKWCKSLLYTYRDIITDLIKQGPITSQPVVRTTTTNQPTQDHRHYERTVDFEEPKKRIRGRIPKEDE